MTGRAQFHPRIAPSGAASASSTRSRCPPFAPCHAINRASVSSVTAFTTSRARVDLTTKDAEGDQPVEARGPMGTVQAKRWRFEEDGRVLHFEGDVKTVLEQDKERPARAEQTETQE